MKGMTGLFPSLRISVKLQNGEMSSETRLMARVASAGQTENASVYLRRAEEGCDRAWLWVGDLGFPPRNCETKKFLETLMQRQ